MKSFGTALVAVVAVSLWLTLASTPSVVAAVGNTEFTMSLGFGQGFLARGGAAGDAEMGPRTMSVSDAGSPAFVGNDIEITSREGFAGTIELQVLNLPTGVTSQTATFVNLAQGNSLKTPFLLQAASNAPLGDHVVTMRATSDTRSWTQDASFRLSVVDHLPPTG